MSNIREQYNAFNRLYDDFIVQLMNFFHKFIKSDFIVNCFINLRKVIFEYQEDCFYQV